MKVLKPLTHSLFALLAIVAITSCRKNNLSELNATSLNTAGGISTTTLLSLSNTPLSNHTVPDDYLGFSYETSLLTDPEWFVSTNTVYLNLLKGLGSNGIIRLGGSAVEKTYWSKNQRKKSTRTDSLYTDDVDRFAAFNQLLNWKVMYGINLGKSTTAIAANEATYVTNKLGSSLYSFDIGNEPDLYINSNLRSSTYQYSDYQAEYSKWVQAIKAACPNAAFTGPAVAYHLDWYQSFVPDFGSKSKALTFHYYRLAPLADTTRALSTLLSFDTALPSKLSTLTQAAQNNGTLFRMAECNSIAGGGEKNVSNTFASALWGIDYLTYLASNGVDGINFHGGDNYYTAIGRSNHVFTARPLYYAMLMFHMAQAKQFLKCTLGTASSGVSAYYFLRKDNKKAVLVVNKALNNSAVINIKSADGKFNVAAVHQLTAPAISSTTGVLLDNTMVDADGNWSAASAVSTSVLSLKQSGVYYQIRVPAMSAYLIILN